jgi:hypothetical protein
MLLSSNWVRTSPFHGEDCGFEFRREYNKIKIMTELNAEEKEYYEAVLAVLKEQRVNTEREVLYETDGGNSVFMKGRFVGYSLNSLVCYVAEIQGKKVEWLE